ncbi:MAG: universal stress protein [Bacillaceae bacterium]|nr:universal stress protein [Bacillaceae bacterium]
MSNRLLVPVDGSDHSIEALHEALRLSAAFDDPYLIVLHVQHSLETFHTKLFFKQEEIEQYLRESGEKVLAKFQPVLENQSVPFETRIEIGNPKVKIIETARSENVEHIFLGARGLGGLSGQILGSVSLGVLHDAMCPVTIVKEKK